MRSKEEALRWGQYAKYQDLRTLKKRNITQRDVANTHLSILCQENVKKYIKVTMCKIEHISVSWREASVPNWLCNCVTQTA